MSWKAIAWAVKQKTGWPARKLLLLMLANYADDGGYCWPSQRTLRDATELSLDTIQRNLKRLADDGLIWIESRPRTSGRWPALAYRLNMLTEPHRAARSGPATEPHHAASPSRKTASHRAAPCGTNLKENLHLNLKEKIENRNGAKNEGKQAKQVKRTTDKKYEPANVVQNKIAERLGKGDIAAGWEMLMEITDDERHHLTACERNGRLTEAVLDNVRGQCALNGHRKG